MQAGLITAGVYYVCRFTRTIPTAAGNTFTHTVIHPASVLIGGRNHTCDVRSSNCMNFLNFINNVLQAQDTNN